MFGQGRMCVEVLTPDDGHRWDAAVNETTAHDTFHHLDYVAAVARGAPMLLRVEEDAAAWVLPVVVHRTRVGPLDGIADAQSAYGYSGPVWTLGWREEAHAGAWELARGALRDLGVVTLLLRLHPELPMPSTWPQGAALRHEGDVVIMRLEDDEEAYWQAMRGGHRYKLRRAQREGLEVSDASSKENVAEFYEIYEATMRRLDARPTYRFRMDAFEQLLRSSEFKTHLLTVHHQREILASGLFLAHEGHAHYFLAGSVPHQHHGSRPTRLMIHHARSVLLSERRTYLNLGGGLGARRDSLFEFKLHFSDETRPFHTLRWVLDEAAYGRACRGVGLAVPPPPESGWFPAHLDPQLAGRTAE